MALQCSRKEEWKEAGTRCDIHRYTWVITPIDVKRPGRARSADIDVAAASRFEGNIPVFPFSKPWNSCTSTCRVNKGRKRSERREVLHSKLDVLRFSKHPEAHLDPARTWQQPPQFPPSPTFSPWSSLSPVLTPQFNRWTTGSTNTLKIRVKKSFRFFSSCRISSLVLPILFLDKISILNSEKNIGNAEFVFVSEFFPKSRHRRIAARPCHELLRFVVAPHSRALNTAPMLASLWAIDSLIHQTPPPHISRTCSLPVTFPRY